MGEEGHRHFTVVLPLEILCPHFKTIFDGRSILFNYNDNYINPCPLIPEEKNVMDNYISFSEIVNFLCHGFIV